MMIWLLCIVSVNFSANEDRSLRSAQTYWNRRGVREVRVCVDVGARARERGLVEIEAIAISHTETRHRHRLTSSAGAKGPMQAMLKYWKRDTDRDYIDAGVRAWSYYRARSQSFREAAGKYNGGGKRSAYAREATKHYQALEALKKGLRHER